MPFIPKPFIHTTTTLQTHKLHFFLYNNNMTQHCILAPDTYNNFYLFISTYSAVFAYFFLHFLNFLWLLTNVPICFYSFFPSKFFVCVVVLDNASLVEMVFVRFVYIYCRCECFLYTGGRR